MINQNKEAIIEKALLNILEDLKIKSDKLERSRKITFNILKDMSEERKKAETERERVKTILKSVGDAIYAVDLDRNIIIFNSSAEKLTGFKAEEIMGKPCHQFLRFYQGEKNISICGENCILDQVLKSGDIVHFPDDTYIITKEGKKLAIADSAAPIRTADRELIGVIVTFRDVTREREVDKMKTMFISITSHQLRTPLSSARWYAEMLLEGDAGELTAMQRDYLSEIYESNLRMIALVNDLLDVSRFEEGKIRIEPKFTDIEEIVESLVKEFQLLSKAHNVIINFKRNEKVLPKVFVDPLKMRQVFQNLIANAINYNKPKGEVDIFFEEKDNSVIFTCKDTGVGIPKEEQWKLFSRFYRGTNVLKKETSGTGLGLFIVKAIVESSGGKIWFESEEDQGSTFYISFPLDLDKREIKKQLKSD